MMLNHVLPEYAFKGCEKPDHENSVQIGSNLNDGTPTAPLKSLLIEERVVVPVFLNIDKRRSRGIQFILDTLKPPFVDFAHDARSRSFASRTNVSLSQSCHSGMPESVKIVHPPLESMGSKRTR